MSSNLVNQLIVDVVDCSYDRNLTDYFVGVLIAIINHIKTQKYFVNKIQIGSIRLIQIKIILRQPFNNNVYDVPIIIHLSKLMPKDPPQFYIELAPGTMINNKNENINPIDNSIKTIGLKSWGTHSQIPPIIDELKASFSKNFPICKAPSNVQTSYVQPSINTYQQQQQPYVDTSKSMPIHQGNLNRPGYMANTTMSTAYGNNTAYQVQMTPQRAQEECRAILLNEATTKVEPKYKEETNKIIQQNKKLLNYQKEFNIEAEKVNQYLMNTDRITMASQDKLREINEEIAKTEEYIKTSQNRQLSSSNCMDFISIEGEKSIMIISLLAKEAMIEEMLVITKKALEKQAIDCEDAIRFIRSSTRDLLAVKYQREKLIDSSSLQY